jgi:hypothetical protein
VVSGTAVEVDSSHKVRATLLQVNAMYDIYKIQVNISLNVCTSILCSGTWRFLWASSVL